MLRKSYLIVAFIIPFSFSITTVARPLLAVSLGIDKALLALIPLASNLAQILFRPFFGSLSDRRGRRIFVVTATTFYSTGYLIQCLARTGLDIIIANFILGIGISMLWPALMAFSSDITKNVREEIGNLLTVAFLGSVFGYILSGFSAELVGWRNTFMIASFLAIIGFIFAILSIHDKIGEKPSRNLLASIIQSYKIGVKVSTNVSSLGLRVLLNIYIPVILVESGFSQSIAGLIITVGSILNTTMQKPSSKLSRSKFFSIKLLNTLALIIVLLIGLAYYFGSIVSLISLYISYNIFGGLLPTAQLSEVTENTTERGSGTGGFGIALSTNRLIASNVASLGGSIQLSMPPIVVSLELATIALFLLSLISFKTNKKNNKKS